MAKVATNLFDSAPSVKIKSAAVEKEAKNKTKDFEIGSDLDSLAAINSLITSLSSMSKMYDTKVKSKMLDVFVDESIRRGKRAENFNGTGELSTASCQLKKRASSSPLTEEQIALLNQHKISYEENVVAEEIPERFFFNPEILKDAELMSIISTKLSEIPELEGKAVILKQEKREKVYNHIVSEDSLDEIAKLQDKNVVKDLLGVVSTLSVKAKLNTQDMDKVLEIVKKTGLKLTKE